MSSIDLKNELLAIGLEDDIHKEMEFLHAEASQSPSQYFGKREGVGLVFSFWRDRHPDLLVDVANDAERLADIWRHCRQSTLDSDDEMPPIDSQYLCLEPLIPCDGVNALLRLYPVISRGLFRLEYNTSPFAQRGGIEFSDTGWLLLLEEAFGWLETQAVARKDAGFPESYIPLLVQVKEKFGGLRISASVPSSLWPEWRERMEAISERSETTCMRCGAPGTMRTNGWRHVHCDACAERGQP
jgi:hypothetical protein